MSDGTIEQSGERVTFRYERRFRHRIDVVWKALTDPAETEAWFGGRVEMELKPGGRFVSHHRGGVAVVDRVVRVEPPRLLEHTYWQEVNPSALVTWDLSPGDEGCVLTLTHSLSMDDVRAAAASVVAGDSVSVILSRNGAGWHRLLDKLEEAIDGTSVEWTEQDQRALQERYAGQLVG